MLTTELQSKKISSNLKNLDVLRGILALYVLLGHCRWMLWAGNNEWTKHEHPWQSDLLATASASLRYGHEAVMIFFVLSGFFIHLRVAKQLAQNSEFKFEFFRFFQRRFHRLIPPYIFALALTLIIDSIGSFLYPTLYNAATGDALLDLNFIKKDFSLTSVIPALFLLPSSLGKDFGTNGPFWSLSYEFVYYLLYPLWLITRRWGALPAYCSGIVVAVLSNYFLEPSFIRSVLTHYPIWLSGAIIAEIVVKKAMPKGIVFLSIFFLLLSFISINTTLPVLPKLLVYALFGSSVVLLFLNYPFSRYQNHIYRFFEFLGLESYTIYICHFPIVAFISAWRIEVFGATPMAGWLAIGVAVLTLLLCHFCFLLCERNFLHSRLKIE